MAAPGTVSRVRAPLVPQDREGRQEPRCTDPHMLAGLSTCIPALTAVSPVLARSVSLADRGRGSRGDANTTKAGRARGDGVTWSGVTALAAGLPAFCNLPATHSSVPSVAEEPTPGAALTPQNPQPTRNGAPSARLGLGNGLLQAPLALTTENAAFGTTPPASGFSSEVAGRNREPGTPRKCKRRDTPPPRRPLPTTPAPLPSFLLSYDFSFSLHFLLGSETRPDPVCPPPLNQFALSRLHWFGVRRPESPSVCASRLPRVWPPAAWPCPAPAWRPSLGVPGCGPCAWGPALPAWSGSSAHRSHPPLCRGSLFCAPPTGIHQDPGLINKLRTAKLASEAFPGTRRNPWALVQARDPAEPHSPGTPMAHANTRGCTL
ncbi:uncharacterized protein LOC129406070 [Sorex araneus]|uniref:uncharacterized protein LOC129406070 n=1 Tax=Sorex araneus TaxID=42254 RepID=UPI002433DA24|nr:uncharacterized protein LOC129406070 [Sorex araneus]